MLNHSLCLLILLTTCGVGHGGEFLINDWQQGAAPSCRFLDARAGGGYEGQIEPLADSSLRIYDNEGGQGAGAEMRCNPAFSPDGDCYRIEFDLALKSVGAMDDSTSLYATAHIYFSVQQVGLDLYIAADRLLFDSQWTQYQMLRSSNEHQRFTFLVDVKRKLMRVSVDGRTLGLYRAYDLPDEGVRVTARGSTKLAAEVNLRNITLSDATWDNSPHQSEVTYEPRALLPAEWPALLRDPQNTSRSPLQGRSASLKVINTIPIAGGSLQDVLTTDLDGDGVKELITQFGGKIRAYNLSGTLLWQSNRSGKIVGLYDLDGDSRDEIVLNPLIALDGATGADKFVVAADSDGEAATMGSWQFVELPLSLYPQPEDGSSQVAESPQSPGKSLCAIFFLVGSDVGYVYRFPQGQKPARRELEFHIAAAATNFNPTLLVTDIDSNGSPDLACITYDRAYAFDLRDGRPRMFHYWSSGRCYAELTAKNIDSDPHPELIVQSCNLREHLSVLENDGLNLSLGWHHFYEQNYPHNKKDYATCLDSVDDFDGDGEVEILQSLYNNAGDKRWHTLMVDAITGRVERDLPDCRLEGVIQRSDNEIPAVLLTRTLDRNRTEAISVLWLGEESRSQAVSDTGSLIKDYSRRNYPAHTAGSASTTYSSRPMLPKGSSGNRFFMLENQAVWEVILPALHADSVSKKLLVEIPNGYGLRELDDVDSDGTVDAVLHSPGENRLQVVSGATSEVLASISTGGPQAVTVAGKMHRDDQELTLLVVDGLARLCAWTDCTSVPKLAWEKSIAPRRSNSGLTPVSIVDIEGDGRREILAGLDGDRLALLDSDGHILREWPLPGKLHDWAFGNFTGDELTDFMVMTMPESGGVQTVLLDAARKDVQPMWSRDIASMYGYPAVVDANQDGIDDVAFRYYFMRHVLDGRNGLDLYPVTWKAGQHCISVVHSEGRQSEPYLLMSGGNYTLRVESLDGAEIWNTPFSDRFRPSAVGDFDGDGRLDVAGQTAGERFELNPFRTIPETWNRHVCLWDLATGEEKGRLALDGTCQGGMVSVDLDGDGRDELVAGTDHGKLVVLGIEADALQVESELEFDATVGRPMVVDLELDGQPEIVVSVEDGNLYLLTCEPADQ
ncbi:hypothetical protein OAS39_04830 [Pirellulales bacterium]|nr:hypothetical protein [Pirellulales bacterium]